MRIEAFNKLGKPINLEVTRLIVYNDFDQPVAVALKHAPGFIYVGHCQDPEFFEVLENLGIKQTYVVDTLNTDDLKPLE